MDYYGDFSEDATVRMYFNTFTSNDPQASATITNLLDADIQVHKDGGLTQIATDGATVTIDFDSITGNHLITIDTSVHADYSVGSDYAVRIEGTTVDAGTINAWVGSFSIENRFNDVNVVTISGTAQTANDNGLDINTLLDRIVGNILAGNHTAQTGDSFARIGALGAGLTSRMAEASINTTGGAIDTVATLTNAPSDSAGVTTLLSRIIGTLAVGAHNPATAAQIAILSDWINGGRLDLILDAVEAATSQMVFTVANQLDVNALAINSNAAAAIRMGLSAGQIIPFTVTNSVFTPTPVEFEVSDITEATPDHFKSRIVLWTTGALAGQITNTTVYALAGSNGHFTVVTMTEAPANGDTGILM